MTESTLLLLLLLSLSCLVSLWLGGKALWFLSHRFRGLLLLEVLLLTPHLCADENRLARFLPPDSLFYVGVEDLSRYRQNLASGNLGELLAEPEVRNFGTRLFAVLEKRTLRLRRELGLVGWEFPDLFPGQFAFAVTDVRTVTRSEDYETPDGTRETYSYDETVANVVFLGELTRDNRTLAELLDCLTARLTSPGGGYLREDTSIGEELVVSLRPLGESGGFSYCFSDDLFVLSNDLTTLKKVLLLLHDPSLPGLDDTRNFLLTVREDLNHGVSDFYLNLEGMFKLVRTDVSAAGIPAFDALGLDSFHALGGSAIPFNQGSLSTISLFTTPHPSGLAAAFDTRPAPFRSPLAAGTDTIAFWAAHLHPGVFFSETLKYFRDAPNPQLNRVHNDLARLQKQLGLSLSKDLFDLAGTETALVWSVREPFTPDAAIDMVLLLQLADEPRFRTNLKSILSVLPFLPETEEVLVENVPVHVAGETTGRPCFAVTHGFLILSNSETEMHAVIHRLNSREETLADNPEFRDRVTLLGPEPIALTFIDSSRLVSYLYRSAIPAMRELATGDLQELLAPEVLPPEETLRRHLFPVTAAAFRTPSGFLLKTYAP